MVEKPVEKNYLSPKFFQYIIRTKLENRPNVRKVIGNTSWLFTDRLLRMGVGVFVGVWIARYLGPEQFGIYSYAAAFVALFSPIVTLGLDAIVVRDLVRYPSNKDGILGTTFILKLFGGVLSFLLTIIIIFILHPGDKLIHWLVGIIAAGSIFTSIDTIDLWFQSQLKSKFTVLAKNIAFLLVVLLKICLLYFKAPLVAFAWAWFIELLMGGIGLLITYHIGRQHVINWKPMMIWAKNLLNESWPMILSGFSIMIYVKIDQIMLGEMVGKHAVGIYSAAIRVSEIWYFIPVAFVASVSPLIVEVKKLGEAIYYQRIQQTFNILVVSAYVVAISITLFSDPIIKILYGPDYIESGPVLVIHIWQGVFVFMGVARVTWIVTEGLTKTALATTSFGAVLNILLNLYLIPLYGPIGSAWATVLSYASSDYLIFVLFPYAPFRKIGHVMTKALTLQFIFNRMHISDNDRA